MNWRVGQKAWRSLCLSLWSAAILAAGCSSQSPAETLRSESSRVALAGGTPALHGGRHEPATGRGVHITKRCLAARAALHAAQRPRMTSVCPSARKWCSAATRSRSVSNSSLWNSVIELHCWQTRWSCAG